MRAIVNALFCLLCVACSGRNSVPPVHVAQAQDYPGFLETSEKLGAPFLVQQHLRGRYGEHKLSLDVVVQLAGGRLTLVGLTPFGSRAFVMTQVGTEILFEKFIDRELPFDPSYVLNDVHRVFFRGLPGPKADGEYSEESHDERVTERWLGGRVVERRFERLDGQPAGAIIARFKGPANPVIASQVELENHWFGYSLTIESSEQRYLE